MATVVQLAWLRSMVVPAQTAQRVWKVPASVTLAQCTLESAWGTSQLSRRANNFFGIKAVQGEDYMEFPTREVIKGRSVMEMADFADYHSAAESFVAHGKLLATLPRYRPAMVCCATLPTFCEQIRACGYSTAPDYAEGLMGIIHQFKLQQYDTLPAQPAASTEAV